MSVLGFDISSNNGQNLDFHAARKAGFRFVFIKVSEGTHYVNPYAKEHTQKAKDAGLLVGAYAFVSPQSDRTGREEADFFLKHAHECGLLEAGCLRPVADIEVTKLPKGQPSRKYHYDFVQRIINTIGTKPFIYTGSWFWDGVLGAKNAHRCPLWLASYTKDFKRYIPKGFHRVNIHQFTDKQSVAGVGPKVDGDRYLGKDVDMLRRHHTLKHKH